MEKWGLGKVNLLVRLSKPGTDQKYKSISEQESKFDSETISEKTLWDFLN